MTLEAAQMEEGPVEGSSSVAVVPHRVRREPPPGPFVRRKPLPRAGGATALVDGRPGSDVGSFLAR